MRLGIDAACREGCEPSRQATTAGSWDRIIFICGRSWGEGGRREKGEGRRKKEEGEGEGRGRPMQAKRDPAMTEIVALKIALTHD
jgi:hypothetical protein